MTASALRAGADQQVEIRRSSKRRRTVSARREGQRTIVFIPEGLSDDEEVHWVGEMVRRLDASDSRKGAGALGSDSALVERARQLSAQFLSGLARPVSVRWVQNQQQRWGSCTPDDGTIRLSHRLKMMPAYVVDFVLLHELAHLLEPGHGPRFVALLGAFSDAAKAQGYLEGFSAAHLVDAPTRPKSERFPEPPVRVPNPHTRPGVNRNGLLLNNNEPSLW
ncbi:M48 family peptidase [Nakamurella antarctica]|uniref:M48 family peptidase n=2 Tax=Nakamurella antarctica TaxID=1902245 RepID=A0A3G8ZRV7_9ACTN|nr:M48 family peptidase [Nakamurella antarctica]